MDSKRQSDMKRLLLLISPALLLYAISFLAPFIMGIYYSFTDWSGLTSLDTDFIGLANYLRIFSDADFWSSLIITLKYTLLNVTGITLFALLFSVMIHKATRSNSLFRTILFLPNLFSLIVTGAVWKFLFRIIIPKLLILTGITDTVVNVLAETNTIIFSLAIVSLWQGVGYVMLIDIAALQGVDQQVVEASVIDGANARQTFFSVILPEIIPVIKVGFVLTMAGSMKVFDSVLSLTNGGPGRASEVTMLNVYREAFERKNFGYGNAKAIILTIIIFLIAIIQLRVSERRDD